MNPTTCPSASQTHVSAFGRCTLAILWRSSSRKSLLRNGCANAEARAQTFSTSSQSAGWYFLITNASEPLCAANAAVQRPRAALSSAAQVHNVMTRIRRGVTQPMQHSPLESRVS